MAASTLVWKAAVVAQDASPLVDKTYQLVEGDSEYTVNMRFADESTVKLTLEPITDSPTNHLISYEYRVTDKSFMADGEIVNDSEAAYPIILKAHKALFVASSDEQLRARSQQR